MDVIIVVEGGEVEATVEEEVPAVVQEVVPETVVEETVDKEKVWRSPGGREIFLES